MIGWHCWCWQVVRINQGCGIKWLLCGIHARRFSHEWRSILVRRCGTACLRTLLVPVHCRRSHSLLLHSSRVLAVSSSRFRQKLTNVAPFFIPHWIAGSPEYTF